MATGYSKGKIYKLDINALQPDPGQARKYMDPGSLAEMTASIAKHGVLEPILFRTGTDGQGGLVVVAGERRVAAAKAAGLTTIPGVFVSGNHREISLVENLLRENLTPIEEAEALDRAMKELKYSQRDLAEMIGKSQGIISMTMSLNNLPENIRDQCRTNPAIPKTVLLEIAALKSPEAMQTKFRRYMDKQRAPEPKEKTAKRTKAELFLERSDLFHSEIINLPWQSWTPEEQEDLKGRMRDLRQGADDLLQAMGDTTAEEQEEESGRILR